MFYSLQQTKSLAKDLAKTAKAGDCYCLIGDLGAGKTEFARSFIQELCGDVKVSSPTYNIVLSYESKHQTPFTIHHFDLYRIKHESELEEIGLDDALKNGICLIEWPQIAANYLPKKRVDINLQIADENLRRIEIRERGAEE